MVYLGSYGIFVGEEKSMFKLKIFMFLFFMSLILYPMFSFTFDSDEVEVKIFKSFDKVHTGKELKIALAVKIKKGWHINSNSPNDDSLIPTLIEIPPEAKFKLSSVDYPMPHDFKFSFSEMPVSVYEGEIYIGGTVKIPQDIQLGEYKVSVQFYYQACNDSTCLAPDSVENEIIIKVVDAGTMPRAINEKIFSKLKTE